MKKITIIIAIIFIAVSLNAQFFIGGEFGVNARTYEVKNNDNITQESVDLYISLSPKGGYYFNDKFALGLSFSLIPHLNATQTGSDNLTWSTSLGWKFAPFVRFHVLTIKKFFFMLEGDISIGGLHTVGSNNKSAPFTLNIGVINVAPYIGYKLTDKIQLEARLNFLKLGYNISIETDKSGSYKTVRTQHYFSHGFNTFDITNLGALTVGAIFKF
jgi:hypothetical protein